MLAWGVEKLVGNWPLILSQKILVQVDPFQLATISADQLRSISFGDFERAVHIIKASVSSDCISTFEEWNLQFGGC